MEDREKKVGEAEEAQRDEGDDVEAHKRHGAAEDKTIAATEEGPDVEAHKKPPHARVT